MLFAYYTGPLRCVLVFPAYSCSTYTDHTTPCVPLPLVSSSRGLLSTFFLPRSPSSAASRLPGFLAHPQALPQEGARDPLPYTAQVLSPPCLQRQLSLGECLLHHTPAEGFAGPVGLTSYDSRTSKYCNQCFSHRSNGYETSPGARSFMSIRIHELENVVSAATDGFVNVPNKR